jgi:hypothetical protein
MVRLWRANEAERGEIAALRAPALVRHLVALDESRIVMLGVDGSVALLAIERPVAGETPASDRGDWTMSFADPLAMGMSHEFLDEVRSAGVGSLGAVRTNAGARRIIADLPAIVTVDGGNVALWFASGRRLDLGQLPAASGRVAVEVVNVAPEPIVVVAFDDGRIETWLPNGEPTGELSAI